MRLSRRVALRLRSVGFAAFCGASLFPSVMAYGDAASLSHTPSAAPRWLSYMAPDNSRPVMMVAALDSFDEGFGAHDAPETSGFVVRSLAFEEATPGKGVGSRKHERAQLPPKLASRFALAVPVDYARMDTLTANGAYAEPSPEVSSAGGTIAEIPMSSPPDGATPSVPAAMLAAVTPADVSSVLVASAASDSDHTGSVHAMADIADLERADPKLTIAMKKEDQSKALKCLAEAVYFEARGESEKGQYAVAQVVMNRTRTGYYPATVCGVVYENKHRRNSCQFSFACDGKPDRVTDQRSWATAKRIAEDVFLNGAYLPEIGTSTHYHATYVRPRWIRDMTDRTRIGTHVFYRVKTWSDEGV